jgi:hypothetical protein
MTTEGLLAPLTSNAPNASRFLATGGHTVILVGVGFGDEARRLMTLLERANRLIGVDEDGTLIGADVLAHPHFTWLRGRVDDVGSVARVAALARGCADVIVFTPQENDTHSAAGIASFLPLLRAGGLALFTGVKLDQPHGLRGLWQHDIQTTLVGAQVEHVHALGLTLGIWWKPPAPSAPRPTSAIDTVKHEQRWADVPAAVSRTVADPDLAIAHLAEGLYCHGQRNRSLVGVLDDYLVAFGHYLRDADVRAETASVRFVRTLRYHGMREAALVTAQKTFAVFAGQQEGASAGNRIGLELVASQLEVNDLTAAQNLVRELHERWPQDLDIAYLLVATQASARDSKVAQVTDQVFARAAAGRVPIEVARDRWQDALDRLNDERFAFIKGAFTPDTVAKLAAWAASQTEAGHLRGTDGRLGPAQWRVLMQDGQNSGFSAMVDRYLGSWFAHADSYLKVLGGGAGHMAWHQDGGTSNSPRRYATFWLALHACGVDRPGIEIVSYPLSSILPAGPALTPRAAYAWSVNEAFLPPSTRWAPAFEPGDLLIFNKYIPHATQVLGRSTPSRSSIDFRLHSLARND